MKICTVSVRAPYPVYVGAGILKRADYFAHYHNTHKEVFIISQKNITQYYLSDIKKSLQAARVHVYEVPDGEDAKSLSVFAALIDYLADHHFHRDALIIALGGGIVCDLAGFVAATYQRGIDVVHCPTSLLAQVDAAIGGKTALNHPQQKNLIGAYWHPKAVFADIDVLASLAEREFIAGLAEVIKYALIYDAAFFDYLTDNMPTILSRDKHTLETIVARSVAYKADIVAQDEREHSGIRQNLNFGHTFGHAIECLTGFSIRHGEAVSIGMVCAAELSNLLGHITSQALRRIYTLITSAQLPIHLPETMDAAAVFEAMQLDKKIHNKQLQVILLSKIGSSFMQSGTESRHVLAAIEKTVSR